MFLAAFCLRLHFALGHPHFDNLFAVRGVPFSDGQQWTSGAIHLAEGEGLGTVFRPGFSIALALFYTWFGYSFNTITALNVLVGSVTASGVFLVARAAFNRPIAAAAACFFVVDPSQIIQTPQASTEPMGLMFFVGSVYCLMLVGEAEKLRPALLGGVLLALSNLTRPLTLFCAPFYTGHLVFAGRSGTQKLRKRLLPAIAFCAGLILTLSPWLIRQRLVHGVWAVSANLGEALYGATSPKYKTWTSLVRLDADRDEVEPTVGARYKYFVAKSLENIQLYPEFYARQVTHSYWQFLNCFNPEVRSRNDTFKYPQWTGLIEAQAWFFWVASALLLISGLRIWIHSGLVPGGIFLFIAAMLVTAWHFSPPYSGVIILLVGLTTSLLRCSWRPIALLSWSLAITGIGDALFNNAILYRAVLMSDWIFSLFYLAAFYFTASLAMNVVLRVFRQAPVSAPLEIAKRTGEPRVILFEYYASLLGKGVVVISLVFVLVSSIRLITLNFGGAPRSKPISIRLSVQDQREVIQRLRSVSSAMRQSLPDPETENIEFVDPKGARAGFKSRSQIAIECEPLTHFIFYFPAGTEFQARDGLFSRRAYDCSMFRMHGWTGLFLGRISASLEGQQVASVGWFGNPYPGGTRIGPVMHCTAIIPILADTGKFDYEHAVIAQPEPTNRLIDK